MTPAAIEEKYGSAMSCTTTPMVLLCPVATALAWRLAVYPSSATARFTRSISCCPTRLAPALTTLDAVVSDTSARSATSCSVTRDAPTVAAGPRWVPAGPRWVPAGPRWVAASRRRVAAGPASVTASPDLLPICHPA